MAPEVKGGQGMGRRVIIAAAIVLLVLAGGSWALLRWFSEEEPPNQAPESGRISVLTLEGEVQRRLGEAAWRPLAVGDELKPSESVRTASGGRARLDVAGIAEVELDQSSQFEVRDISKAVAEVRVEEGRLGAVVHGRGASKLRVTARGSDAVAESGEGEFNVLASGRGDMVVATKQGRVRLSAKNKSVVVESGQQALVAKNSQPSAPEAVPPSLFLKVGDPQQRLQRQKQTTIRGTATPGAVISVNGVRVETSPEGVFTATVPLSEGKNEIKVTATDAVGRRHAVDLPAVTVKSSVSRVRSQARWGSQADVGK